MRIATELNLHRSYARAIKGSSEHFEGARLWYLLYVCDHHFSIAYGRPPVIQDDASIIFHEEFLKLPGITQADFRLHSQVGLFIILTQIYNAFGPDIEQQLDEQELDQLRRWNIEIDRWRVRWEPQLGTDINPIGLFSLDWFSQVLAPNPHISSYPSRGVHLHYHFARLQLNSLSLRGVQQLSLQNLSTSRREYANQAISCALAILQLVITEPDIKDALNGVPLYLHTMITYAAVFLLKVQQQWKSVGLVTDTVLVHETVAHVITLLNEVRASDRHLSYHIARGLGKMLERLDQAAVSALESHDHSIRQRRQENSTEGTGGEVGAGAALHGVDAEYELGENYGSIPMYGEPTAWFDQNSFPTGFFDVTAIGGPWQWQPGTV